MESATKQGVENPVYANDGGDNAYEELNHTYPQHSLPTKQSAPVVDRKSRQYPLRVIVATAIITCVLSVLITALVCMMAVKEQNKCDPNPGKNPGKFTLRCLMFGIMKNACTSYFLILL